ncbi:MAG TPA: STAS domain-containing protein [Candidatus Binatia bacterium]|nr:STAS domain-containing protein [Candidatus Binatia bacterium]
MRNEQINTALPEGGFGAASWGSAGTLESLRPQARAADHGDFALILERDGSETAVLVLAGELDLYRAPAIEGALAKAIAPKLGSDRVHHLTVDLRLVTFIDSTTLLLLLGASRRQQAEGGHLLVLVGPQTPMTAFEAVGFDRLLAITRSDDEPGNSVVRTVSSERIDLSPPPHTTFKGRNHNGNNGSN